MGGWLVTWLNHLGAKVYGYALPPPTDPSIYEAARIRHALAGETIADIRDSRRLTATVSALKPDIVFHLAAQPIVRRAHSSPLETFDVNVMGTVNLLEAVRASPDTRTVVVTTSDKVYRNLEIDWEYREADGLGGQEPYGASKACAEYVVESYRGSYFEQQRVGVATVRAGNVIGGGDWAPDRLIPDAVRASCADEPLIVRNPNSYRPWQHVLEALHGQIMLAENLHADPVRYGAAWNFGPRQSDHKPVSYIVDECARHLGLRIEWQNGAQPYEAGKLAVASGHATAQLGWYSVWQLEEALIRTIDWYGMYRKGGADLWAKTLDDISAFVCAARQSN
jgi:CDP-glucose 4,6-dehydratase